MNNSVSSHKASGIVQPNFPAEVVVQKADRMEFLLGWWYRITTPPRPPANASFVKREIDRKARLLSTIIFFYLIIQVLFLLGSIIASPESILSSLVGDLSIIGSVLLCRNGKVKAGGWVLVGWFELSLASAILIMKPLGVLDIPLYDLFIVGELLAVSLLPLSGVFIIAVANSLFMVFDLFYEARTQALTLAMSKEVIATVLVRPIAIQIIVACITSIWVYSASRAIERANRAEMVAALEHVVAEQRASIEQEKQELEASIQQLIRLHIDTTNDQLAARIPYPPAKVLWPLVGVINSLWVRLRNFQQIEREHERLKRAIAMYNEQLQHSATFQLPMRTGTDLDLLIFSLKKIQEPSRPGMPRSRDMTE
jgi:hypothetical protein